MAVPSGYEFVPYLAIVIHIIVSCSLVAYTFKKKKERTKSLPILFAINSAAFIVLVFIITAYSDSKEGVDFLAFMAYSVLGTYVAAIEIPGYLILSRFDGKLSDDLQSIRKGVVSLNFESTDMGILETRTSSMKSRLKELLLDDVVENFVASYKRMQQVDRTLYDITLKELGENIQHVSNRSKHPFPKLIEILSLAGISFLIGQFLNHFLP